MRIGLYLGRHAGAGGGMAVYARELVAGLVRLLESPGNDQVELVLYGDDRTLDAELRETIAISSLLSAESDGWDLRSADSYFQPLPNGARCRVLLRRLSSWGGHKPGMIADQLLLPLRMRTDRVRIVHSVANIALLLSPGVRVVTVHDLYQGWPPAVDAESKDVSSQPPAPGTVQRIYRSMFKAQFRRVHHVITDVASVADEITRRFGFDRARISPIALGLDRHVAGFITHPPDLSLVSRRVRALSEQHDIPAGAVLLLGGLDPRKNFRRSLEAFFLVTEEIPELTLVVRGGERGIHSLIQSAAGDRMPRVRVLPWIEREQLPYLLLGSSVLLAPTLAEGYGLPAAEALALGVPVVSGPLEITRRGEQTPHFVCAPGDVASIGSALRKALEHSRIASERTYDAQRAIERNEAIVRERAEAILRRSRGEARELPRTLGETAADTLALYRGVSIRYR